MFFNFRREIVNINKEMRLRQWAQDMAEQKASGLSQKQWCKMKGIGSTTYEYRCRKVREVMEQKLVEKEAEKNAIISAANKAESLCEQEPFFAKVNLTGMTGSSLGMQINSHGMLFNIAPDAPAEHVRMVLEVLVNAH